MATTQEEQQNAEQSCLFDACTTIVMAGMLLLHAHAQVWQKREGEEALFVSRLAAGRTPPLVLDVTTQL
jgi:hypothetical protein